MKVEKGYMWCTAALKKRHFSSLIFKQYELSKQWIVLEDCRGTEEVLERRKVQKGYCENEGTEEILESTKVQKRCRREQMY